MRGGLLLRGEREEKVIEGRGLLIRGGRKGDGAYF